MALRPMRLACSIVGCALLSNVTPVAADEPVFFSWHRNFVNGSDDPPFPASGTTGTYTYNPSPGHNCGDHTIEGVDGAWTLDAWDDMAVAGHPIAILLKTANAPWGSGPMWDDDGGTNPSDTTCLRPWQLAYAFAYLYDIDSQIEYVLCDIEPSHTTNGMTGVDAFMAEIAEIVTGAYSGGVTGDPYGTGNINVPQSVIQNTWDPIWFGNYGCHRYPYDDVEYDAYVDITAITENQGTSQNVEDKHFTYIDNGLNVIMPVAYVTDTDVRHCLGNIWTGVQSPTHRAAYMWSSIEKLSMAVREELAAEGDGWPLNGKKVIPWVNPYGDKTANTPSTSPNTCGWMPPPADFLAIIKHQRLRGTDGFYYFNGGFNDPTNPNNEFTQENWFAQDGQQNHLNPWYYPDVEWANGLRLEGAAWFEAKAIVSWEELDGEFADDAIPYRLETDKTSAAIVSAMNDKGHLCIFVSYMDDPGTNIDIDAYFPKARDYNGTHPTQYLTVSDNSHTYTAEFYTPDIDGDGDVDCDDLYEYTALVNANDPRTDWDRDSDIDSTDITYFFDAWEAATGVSYLTCF